MNVAIDSRKKETLSQNDKELDLSPENVHKNKKVLEAIKEKAKELKLEM